jgi:hypothetical protein
MCRKEESIPLNLPESEKSISAHSASRVIPVGTSWVSWENNNDHK